MDKNSEQETTQPAPSPSIQPQQTPEPTTSLDENKNKQGWFLIKHAYFLGGRTKEEDVRSYFKAVSAVKKKPRQSHTVYSWYNYDKKLSTISEGASWYENGSGNMFQFVYGTHLGHRSKGRILIKMEGVQITGGSLEKIVASDVKTEEEAISLIKSKNIHWMKDAT